MNLLGSHQLIKKDVPICAKLYLSCFGSSNSYSVNRILCNTIMIAHISATPSSCAFAVYSLFIYGNIRLFKMIYQLIPHW